MPPKTPARALVTVAEAAGLLDVAPTTIYGMIERGELTADKDHEPFLLAAEDVMAAPKRGRGHPPVYPPEMHRRVQVGRRATPRASDAEYERWKKAANKIGLDVGPWLRKLANENS